MITKTNFIKQVNKELETLRTDLTEEQKNKLNIEDFDPYDPHFCIYGQIFDYCFHKDAVKLYSKIYECLISRTVFERMGFKYHSFKKSENSLKSGYTPLEKYLTMVDSKKHKEIIDFIKCKINNINLNVI